jgi:hypothetical protein
MYDKLIKNILAYIESKRSLSNRYKGDLKKAKLSEDSNDTKINYLTIQLKELEQRNKILSFQLNQQNSQTKKNLKKYEESHNALLKMTALIQEKDEELKILITQMNQLRKITKQSILNPLENNIEPDKPIVQIKESEEVIA